MREFFKGWRGNRLLFIIVAAYDVTWIGGWHFHWKEISTEAQLRYDRTRALNAKWKEISDDQVELRHGGPQYGVDWCVPILPGVLLADSFYVVGPLYGKGGLKLVLYYGFGTLTLLELYGWIA